ncbi:MAG: universal stress protein [Acidobacteriota bacterium]|nr:MAG: universal stress protein [Acidobacteriota bacterium]
MKILLAVDGSPCSENAVKQIAGRCWHPGTEVKILHVIDSPIPDIPDITTFFIFYAGRLQKLDEARRHAPELIEKAVNLIRSTEEGKRLQVVTEVIEGPAKDTILDEAERWGANLIVVGAHGYGAIKRLVLGSVSQAVASHAPCSVEIVR